VTVRLWRFINLSLHVGRWPRDFVAGTNGGSAMQAQHWYWVGAAAALLLATVAGIAEARRQRRDRLDDIGWVPWRGIQVAAVFTFLAAVILGFKLG
jgi:hypothetical protein